MRVQTACNLTVRLTWHGPGAGETYGCVQDEDMARTMARFCAANAPAERQLVSVETSPTGGRRDPWTPLEFRE